LDRLRLVLVLAAALARAAPSQAQILWPLGPNGVSLEKPPLLKAERTAPAPSRDVLADIYVSPARPGQNRVAYWHWDWHTFDFNTERGGGGVRLYFYEREREAASYAVASIREQYVRLTDFFHYLPRTTIPFILYASYAEFQATNVFSVSEGTLGATDPRDLRMALPFFGNVHEFTRVSTHEMVHQITIQKIRDAALGARVESPLGLFPLWFIEGLAEYGTFAGMDPEGDYIVRDLLTNPDALRGYALPDFFNDRSGGYIGVYKLGQARLTFLAEAYGPEKIVEILERSPEMAGASRPGAGSNGAGSDDSGKRKPSNDPTGAATPTTTAEGQADAPPEQGKPAEDQQRVDDEGLPPDSRVSAQGDGNKDAKDKPRPGLRDFEQFLSFVVGEAPSRIRARYQEWLKKRYFSDYLRARQTVADFVHYKPVVGEPDSIAMADDGHLFAYRTVERDTASSALWLQDVRDPSSRVLVARDQRPGLESLHPVDRRVVSVRGSTVLFAARSGEQDALFVRRIERKEGERAGRVTVKLKLTGERKLTLGEVLEVYDPALSPDGRKVAFAGIDAAGCRDLYVLTLEGPSQGKVERLTRDIWAEGDLYWDGARLLFTSDDTEDHEPNLFSYDFAAKAKTRLTFHKKPDRNPVPALGGVVFRSNKGGKPDLWLLKDGKERRLTDTTSAMLAAVPTTGDALLALAFHSGRYAIYRIPPTAQHKEEPVPAAAQAEPAAGGAVGGAIGMLKEFAYAKADIPEATPLYNPRLSRNWRIEASGAAMVGPVSAGAAGVAITDLMRDHVVILNLAVYGSFKLTDAAAFYLNQSHRLEYGFGLFHNFEPLRDKTFPNVTNYYYQRNFGVAGLVRYPLDRFRRVEASLEVRGVDRFAFTDYTGDLSHAWSQLNGGIDAEVVASVLAGYDSMRLHFLAGPVEGTSILATLSGGYLPGRDFAYLRFLGDAQHRFDIFGRTNLLLRAAVGATSQGRFSPQFFLTPVDNLEGYRFGDDRLLGNYFYVANLRLSVPLDVLVQVPFLTAIYGVGGFDFGAATDQLSDAWRNRSLAGVLGTDVALGALLLQFHFGKLIDIGGAPGSAPWVFNLNLRYLYF
jgi:hypothetical protein